MLSIWNSIWTNFSRLLRQVRPPEYIQIYSKCIHIHVRNMDTIHYEYDMPRVRWIRYGYEYDTANGVSYSYLASTSYISPGHASRLANLQLLSGDLTMSQLWIAGTSRFVQQLSFAVEKIPMWSVSSYAARHDTSTRILVLSWVCQFPDRSGGTSCSYYSKWWHSG
jgi:hypothetical protein